MNFVRLGDVDPLLFYKPYHLEVSKRDDIVIRTWQCTCYYQS